MYHSNTNNIYLKNYFLGQLSADCEVWKLLSQSESKLNFLAVRNRGYGHFSPFFFVLILTLKKPCGPFMNLQRGRGSNYLFHFLNFPDKKEKKTKLLLWGRARVSDISETWRVLKSLTNIFFLLWLGKSGLVGLVGLFLFDRFNLVFFGGTFDHANLNA